MSDNVEAAAEEIEPSPGARGRALEAPAAIVHDWFQGFHGAERTVDAMLDLFAHDPDIYTFSAERDLLPPRLARAIKHESRLARLPAIRQRGHEPGRWRWLLPYMPRYFGHLDLDAYDVVISSSHACAAGVVTRPDTLHLCYCHTPMRYVWLPDAERQRVRGAPGVALNALREKLRDWDRRASQRPDLYLANSSAVAERIEQFYGRPATVVHPPVAIHEFPDDLPRERDHFLWVHRLVSYKRPLEVAAAFRELGDLRLTMVGVGPLERPLRASLPDNVTLKGWVSRTELSRLYARAGGFIHIGEEDFGITMVEALAAGVPVLASDRGGARDIVRPLRDGILISAPDEPGEIRDGVRQIAEREWDRQALRSRAASFSEERFRERLADILRAHGAR